ncbi:sodium:solute symporter family transporter [Rubritalea tangerina]|uniref:Sodium:solute symporter n=1 Tax=Rubritalea tangerina TaxID=430798 RepID=A0ABW4Z7E2_9BACT
MPLIDLTIVIVYLLLMTAVGMWASKKASGSTDEYFLGGRSMPWWLLGISGMASFVDVGATALVSGILYLLGMKGIWFMWNGHIALLLSFQMVYAAKWMRRSGCATNAEWMTLRFGRGRPGSAARVATAIGALAIAIGFMPFFWRGAGEVLSGFIPFFEGQQNLAAACFFGLIALYTVSSGFHGVIYTDFFQAFLILFLILYVATQALYTGTPEYFAQHAPDGWFNPHPNGATESTPRDYSGVQAAKSLMDQLPLLLPLVGFWFLNNILQGAATPFDAWTAQRYYAAKNEREASLVSAQWISLTSLRWLLLAGIAVLALPYAMDIGHPEKTFSTVLTKVLPVGISGLMLAALISAGMSTVDTTVNSCAAYYVKDIYQPFINPDASEKKLTRIAHIVSFLILFVGGLLGTFATNIDSVWNWIIMGLFVGTLPPNILKWFWWRFNGWGFAGGCISGFLAALATFLPVIQNLKANLTTSIPLLGADQIFTFSFVFIIATLGTITFTLCSQPTNRDELVAFYQNTRPFGFWGPIRAIADSHTVAHAKAENKRDIALLPIACLWHFSLFTLWPCLIFKQWHFVIPLLATLLVTGGLLWKFWYKNLKSPD